MSVALAPTAAHRRALDLEALLVWAIRDQKADRSDAALHPVEAIAHFGRLHGLPAGAWARHRGVSADGCATIANRHMVGTHIDGGGPIRGVPARIHPDAERVADAIERLPSPERRTVLRHARAADRPDWLPLTAPLVAVTRPSDAPGRRRHVVSEEWRATPKRSEVAQLYLARGISLFDGQGLRRIPAEEKGFRFRLLGDGARQVLASWCPLEPLHGQREIVETNEAYLLWHGAMVALFAALRGVALRDHALTGFAALERPWMNKKGI